MKSFLNENDVNIRVNLRCGQNKQKLMIHALLACSEFDFELIGSCLSVSTTSVIDVYEGKSFFSSEQLLCLTQLFLMRFVGCIDFFERFT